MHQSATWSTNYSEKIAHLIYSMECEEEELLLIDLINRFKYLNGFEYEQSLKMIASTIVDNWRLKPQDTMIISKNLDDGTDSSDAVVHSLKHKFSPYISAGWSKNNFSNHVRKCLDKPSTSNFVVADDFIGSGNQLYDFCEWFELEAAKRGKANPNLYVVCVAAMATALSKSYTPSFRDIYSHVKLNKGISEQISDPQSVTTALDLMKTIERRNRVSEKYRFGYEKSEALYYCESLGVPNNVFPVFWKRSFSSTIFDRI
ncbi:hypothetical protein GCM10007908_13450 [Rhizobium albus]|nr:hypothetical protein GCM10007908_13450 [Rhizobium albus]